MAELMRYFKTRVFHFRGSNGDSTVEVQPGQSSIFGAIVEKAPFATANKNRPIRRADVFSTTTAQ
jgi:hypothetical protein